MSSSAPALVFNSVSKCYLWRQDQARSFRDVFASVVKRRAAPRRFWALQDFSLAVWPGEAVGLIGPNGAGKSTALKLASHVVEPTQGSTSVSGRLSALLELGAGFHPDLTGRENVFLSGAIMGLSRRETEHYYDAILDFAGIGDFIDTPLRHYSSGMAMRLGFAVATSLKPDVLLVDEVLAVGDRAFSSKCLERVRTLKEQGTAVLFVSHDLEAVRHFCDRAVLLDTGRIVTAGAPDAVIQQYLEMVANAGAGHSGGSGEQRWGSREIAIADVWLEDTAGERVSGVAADEPVVVVIRYRRNTAVSEPLAVGLAFQDSAGYLLSGPNSLRQGLFINNEAQEGEVRCHIRRLPFAPGKYFLSASLYDTALLHPYDHWDMCRTVLISGSEERAGFGPVHLDAHWQHLF